MEKPRKALFLDRDGVINVDTGYVNTREKFVPIQENLAVIKDILTGDEYLVFVITNQAGIARGYFTEEEFLEFQAFVEDFLRTEGIPVERTYYCPHHPVEGVIPEYVKECDCRKPAPGMLLQAADDYEIDLNNSIFIGDKESDRIAGEAAGCKVILV